MSTMEERRLEALHSGNVADIASLAGLLSFLDEEERKHREYSGGFMSSDEAVANAIIVAGRIGAARDGHADYYEDAALVVHLALAVHWSALQALARSTLTRPDRLDESLAYLRAVTRDAGSLRTRWQPSEDQSVVPTAVIDTLDDFTAEATS